MDSPNAAIEYRSGASGEKTAFISGTRVRVSDIARLYTIMRETIIIERMLQALPSLSEEQVAAALAFWRENEKEIENEINQENEILSKISTE